jgi:hypothetical protein
MAAKSVREMGSVLVCVVAMKPSSAEDGRQSLAKPEEKCLKHLKYLDFDR